MHRTGSGLLWRQFQPSALAASIWAFQSSTLADASTSVKQAETVTAVGPSRRQLQ